MKVCLDSRLIKKGDYFVPIVGESFDGHKFIETAMKNGAAGVIEEDELYNMASSKLLKISPKVIAVTGSVGKTTVTSFISTILETKYKVCRGSLNTKLGLATNIINNMDNDDQFFVAETGMDYSGELTETGRFINPDLAVITNISESHIGKLGSLESIKKAKAELLLTVKNNGVVVLNWDDENIRSISNVVRNDTKLIKYAYNDLADVDFSKKDIPEVKLSVIGEHNITNIICAVAICKHCGLDKKELGIGVRKIKSPKGRLNILDGINGSLLVDDTYNASPVSAKYALKSIAEYFEGYSLHGRKIAVLGGMLELGDFEDKAHIMVGDYVIDNNIDILVLVGDLAKKLKLSKKLNESMVEIVEFSDWKSTSDFIINSLKPQKGDIILLKASQGIRLEKVVESLLHDPRNAKDLLVRQDERWT